MQCIILAAGFGTRLQDKFPDTAKALVPLNGRAIIEYTTSRLNGLVDNIYVVSNNKFFGDFISWNTSPNIHILNNGVDSNENRLGSIGDIIYTIDQANIDDDLLIIGGDNILEFSLADFIHSFREHNDPMIAVYDVKDTEIAKLMGVVEVKDGIICDFVEKPEVPKSTLASTLAYLLPRNAVGSFYEYKEQNPGRLDKAGHYIQWLTSKRPTRAYSFKGNWFDIGSFDQLQAAERYFKSKSLKEQDEEFEL